MKTADNEIEKFMHDWGATLWAYFDKVGYYDKTDVGMRVELKQLLKQHAKESFKAGEDFGYRMVDLRVDSVNTDVAFEDWYSEWIKEQ